MLPAENPFLDADGAPKDQYGFGELALGAEGQSEPGQGDAQAFVVCTGFVSLLNGDREQPRGFSMLILRGGCLPGLDQLLSGRALAKRVGSTDDEHANPRQ